MGLLRSRDGRRRAAAARPTPASPCAHDETTREQEVARNEAYHLTKLVAKRHDGRNDEEGDRRAPAATMAVARAKGELALGREGNEVERALRRWRGGFIG